MFLADLLLGAAISGLVGFLLVIPAIVLEWRVHSHEHHLPILVDIKRRWPLRSLTHRELFFVALAIHLIFATLFGLIYVVFVEQGWLFVTHSPYTILSLLVYAVLSWVVVMLVIFPSIGFGFFGRREEGPVWAEILSTHLVLGVAMWLLVQWFQPTYFAL